jgi:hypothetical protein
MEEGNVEEYQVGIDLYVFSPFLLTSLFHLLFLVFPPFLLSPYPLFLLIPMSCSAILSFLIEIPFFSSLPSFPFPSQFITHPNHSIADISSGEQD